MGEWDDENYKISDLKGFRLLMNFARPSFSSLAWSLCLLFTSGALAMWSSKLVGDFVEKGLVDKNWNKAILLAFGIVFLEALSVLFVWIGKRKLAATSANIILQIRKNIFSHLQMLPMSYYDQTPQGKVVTRVTHDVEGIEEFFTSGLGNFIQSFMLASLAIAAMCFANFKLGLIMTVAMIPSFYFTVKTKDIFRNSNRSVSRLSSTINAKISEYVSGIDVIRSFGLEKWSVSQYKKNVDDYLKAQLIGNSTYAWAMPLITFLVTLPLIGLVWFGGREVLDKTMGIGLFISFIRFYDRFSNPLMTMAREIHTVQQALTSVERVMNFLSVQTEDHLFGKAQDYVERSLIGRIEFENVSMGYVDNKLALRNISFEIDSGKRVGLVGATGSGKSTAVSLLLRLYDYQEGNIYLDSKELRQYNRDFIRDQIGLVSQDAIIFKGTLRENLTIDDQVTDADIVHAAKLTGLFQCFKRNGFDLNMGINENGQNLSMGERQLLSLTRIMLKNPSILILDEATANIDPETEFIIQSAVQKLMEGRTCLFIAHRLSTLKDCQQILVFRDGELVENGSLNDLVNDKKSYFSQLYEASFSSGH